jgi:hypothetical protein
MELELLVLAAVVVFVHGQHACGDSGTLMINLIPF